MGPTVAAGDARAFWVMSPGHGEIRPAGAIRASAHQVVVRTLFTGVSRGTEALVFSGRVPPSERERMRAPFQEGEFPGPVKYGYQNVGVVESGDPALDGRTVFTLFPHQTRFAVPAAAVHVLPDGVPAARGVLAANLETAINGVWDAGIRLGDRIVVVGGGAVGCLAAWLAARVPGCEVQLVDINAERSRVAQSLGVDFAEPGRVRADADVVLHASGTASGLRTALEAAALEATIVELSWYGNQPVAVPLGEAFHAKRLTLKSSQVGRLPPDRGALWTHRRRMALALRLLADHRLDALISGESPFEELPTVMAQLTSSPASVLCHRICY